MKHFRKSCYEEAIKALQETGFYKVTAGNTVEQRQMAHRYYIGLSSIMTRRNRSKPNLSVRLGEGFTVGVFLLAAKKTAKKAKKVTKATKAKKAKKAKKVTK